MQLVKQGNYTEVSGEKSLTSITDTIDFMVSYFQSTFLPMEKWLTRQERKFFICSVMIANKNIRYTSSEALHIFKTIFNLRRQSDIRGLIVRLEEKGWLTSDKKEKTLSVPEFFKINLHSQKVKFEVVLNFENGIDR